MRFDDCDVWSRDIISPTQLGHFSLADFLHLPQPPDFLHAGQPTAVFILISHNALFLYFYVVYLWAELCLRGASFETGTVRHSADTYLVQRTLHYAGRARSAASGSLGCWVSVVDMKAKPAKETTPLAVAGRCKPMKVEKPRKPRIHKVKQGTPPKLSASQKRKLVRLYVFTQLSWKDMTSLVMHFGRKAIK